MLVNILGIVYNLDWKQIKASFIRPVKSRTFLANVLQFPAPLQH